MTVQQVDKELRAHRIPGRREDIGTVRIRAGGLDGIAEEIALIGGDLITLGEGAGYGGQRGAEMGAYIIAMADQAAFGLDQTAAGRADLEQYAQRTIDLRIGRALADIEIVETLLGRVEAGLAVQEVDVVLGDAQGQVTRLFRDQRIAAQGFARVEVESALRAHFVEVGGDHRLPAMPLRKPGLAFRLGLQQPLPVEVEPVVIDAGRGPQIVLFMIRIRGRHGGGKGLHMIDPARMSVRIEHRRDQDHRFAQIRFHFQAFGRSVVVKGRDGGIHARRFCAVDAIIQPDHRRAVTGGRARVQGGQVGVADIVDAGLVVRRGDDEEQDRPALMGIADRFDADAVGNLCQLAQIGDHQVMTHRPVADTKAEKFFRRRDALIIGHTVHLIEFNRFRLRGRRNRRQGHRCGGTRH